MKVVITGPTGAIGMALIQKCIEERTPVLAICHPGSKRIANIPVSPYVMIIECDLANLHRAAEQCNEKYDVFYHFAWAGTVGDARNDMYLQNQNVRYALDAVQLAKKLGCHTFIGAGSQAEYGRVSGLLEADTPVHPENGYGMAKLCAGQMTRQICEKMGMKHIWVRILSVYGPYDGENSMVSHTIKVLMDGKRASFTPGEQMWDYLYSDDAAEAFRKIAKSGTAGKTYVLGSGKCDRLKTYIEEIYQAVCEVREHPGTLGIGDVPYADRQVMYLGADLTELTKDTGFVPGTSFGVGIRKTLAFHRGTMG